MERDPIVAEVRATREAYARKFHYDLRAACRDLKEQEQSSSRKAVSFPPRRPATIENIGPNTERSA
jgi:hypothetical protein